MKHLRQKGGIAGFPRREESRYDTFMEEFSNILSRYAAGQEA